MWEKKMHIGLHVKYFLFPSDFSEAWIFGHILEKYLVSWQSVLWEPSCFKRIDGRTAGHIEANKNFSQCWEIA